MPFLKKPYKKIPQPFAGLQKLSTQMHLYWQKRINYSLK